MKENEVPQAKGGTKWQEGGPQGGRLSSPDCGYYMARRGTTGRAIGETHWRKIFKLFITCFCPVPACAGKHLDLNKIFKTSCINFTLPDDNVLV